MTDHRPHLQQRMRRIAARRWFAAVTFPCAILLSGCGAGGALFGGYDLPESEVAADAPWPSLVDAPEAVAPGVYTDDLPNPVTGMLVVEDLTAEAASSAARAEALSGPLIGAAELRRLGR